MRTAFWILLSLFILQLIIEGVYHNTRDFSKSLSMVGDIVKIAASLGTLVIALLLFDKFGVRKKIVEDRIYLVLDLISQVKNLRISAHAKENTSETYMPWINASKDMSGYKKVKEINNLIVVFDVEDFQEGLKGILKILNNSLIPIEIKEQLNFFEISKASPGINDNIDCVKICFTKNSFLPTDDQKWFDVNGQEMNFVTFITNLENFLVAGEIWINKHMNPKIKLNI